MSNLKRAIERAGKREGGQLGFAQAIHVKRRAMLLAVVAADAAAVKAAAEAGADLVLLTAESAVDATRELGRVAGLKVPVGPVLTSLGAGDATALREAACDFVVSPLSATAAEALDGGSMGHALTVDHGLDDAMLRALGPLGLDALVVDGPKNGFSVADQLGLIRLAQLASTPLIVRLASLPGAGELRALRDSGVAIVAAPAGSKPKEIEALASALQAVPEPRRREGRGPEIALLPSLLGAGHEHDDDDEPDDE
jgi:2-methylisocitrate lyase-like PEP mutase family enzyme